MSEQNKRDNEELEDIFREFEDARITPEEYAGGEPSHSQIPLSDAPGTDSGQTEQNEASDAPGAGDEISGNTPKDSSRHDGAKTKRNGDKQGKAGSTARTSKAASKGNPKSKPKSSSKSASKSNSKSNSKPGTKKQLLYIAIGVAVTAAIIVLIIFVNQRINSGSQSSLVDNAASSTSRQTMPGGQEQTLPGRDSDSSDDPDNTSTDGGNGNAGDNPGGDQANGQGNSPDANSSANPNGNTYDASETVARINQGQTENLQFGKYTWEVLATADDRALIITETVIERRAFDSESGMTGWAQSDLREYLNGDFLNEFTEDQQALIRERIVTTPGNPWFDISDGRETRDKVFLLSIEEAVRYFGDSGQLKNRPKDARSIDDQYNSGRIAQLSDGTNSWWWLRSRGDNLGSIAFVDNKGVIYVIGIFGIVPIGGVRPALWLNLQ